MIRERGSLRDVGTVLGREQSTTIHFSGCGRRHRRDYDDANSDGYRVGRSKQVKRLHCCCHIWLVTGNICQERQVTLVPGLIDHWRCDELQKCLLIMASSVYIPPNPHTATDLSGKFHSTGAREVSIKAGQQSSSPLKMLVTIILLRSISVRADSEQLSAARACLHNLALIFRGNLEARCSES